MINSHECITECPRWNICSTPVYTGRCSRVCFELKKKYKDMHSSYNDPNIAYWQTRAQFNDFLWTECSNCKFKVEAYKAVKQGRSSTDYERVIYNFCPICGREMRVH